MSKKAMSINGHTVEVKHLEKVFFPAENITKGDLIAYYQRIAETMLPYLEGRPLTMQRFPDGIDAGGFYQKKMPDYFPDWISRASIHVEEDGREQRQVVCDNKATLVYLANQACITPHIWLSRADRLNAPDKLIFDLDPPSNDFGPVRQAAQGLHDLLIDLDVSSFVMTTGSQGLHVVVPLDRRSNFDAVRDLARQIAELLSQRDPDGLTTTLDKDGREGKLFLDYLRNAYGQNSVAPYAIRALPGAPIATPLDWSELDNPELDAQRYHMGNIFRRLGQKEDPWQGLMDEVHSLDKIKERLEDINNSVA